jgi:hypothetical protein
MTDADKYRSSMHGPEISIAGSALPHFHVEYPLLFPQGEVNKSFAAAWCRECGVEIMGIVQ